LPPPHYLTQTPLRYYFATDSRLGLKAQAAQVRLEVALHRVQAVHPQQAELLKHPLSLRLEALIDHL
jgi:hypothetical protein